MPGNVNPGVSFRNNGLQITYDTGDRSLNLNNTSASAQPGPNGVVFHFNAKEQYYTSTAIPFSAFPPRAWGVQNATLTFDRRTGDVVASYGIQVTNTNAFANF